LPSYDVAESIAKYEEVTDFEFEPLELLWRCYWNNWDFSLTIDFFLFINCYINGSFSLNNLKLKFHSTKSFIKLYFLFESFLWYYYIGIYWFQEIAFLKIFFCIFEFCKDLCLKFIK
jgi:hypothetical protein